MDDFLEYVCPAAPLRVLPLLLHIMAVTVPAKIFIASARENAAAPASHAVPNTGPAQAYASHDLESAGLRELPREASSGAWIDDVLSICVKAYVDSKVDRSPIYTYIIHRPMLNIY